MDIQDWNPPYPVNFPGDMIRMYTRECLVMSQMVQMVTNGMLDRISTLIVISLSDYSNNRMYHERHIHDGPPVEEEHVEQHQD